MCCSASMAILPTAPKNYCPRTGATRRWRPNRQLPRLPDRRRQLVIQSGHRRQAAPGQTDRRRPRLKLSTSARRNLDYQAQCNRAAPRSRGGERGTRARARAPLWSIAGWAVPGRLGVSVVYTESAQRRRL